MGGFDEGEVGKSTSIERDSSKKTGRRRRIVTKTEGRQPRSPVRDGEDSRVESGMQSFVLQARLRL